MQVNAVNQIKGIFYGKMKKKKLTDILSDHSAENKGENYEA